MPTDTPNAIVVALDTASPAGHAVETAADLAARFGLQLVGVFIEDVELLHTVELPFVAMVRPTGSVRPIDTATMERAFRASAARHREELRRSAEGSNLRFSFRVTRGRLCRELHETGGERDLVVVGTAPERAASSGPVVALLEDEASADQVRAVAHRIAQSGEAVVTLLTPELEAPRAAAASGHPSRSSHVRRVRKNDSNDVASALHAVKGRMLVVHSSSPLLTEPVLRVLRSKIGCPVVVVR